MRAVTHLFEYMKFKFSFPPVFSRGLFADNYFWLIFFHYNNNGAVSEALLPPVLR